MQFILNIAPHILVLWAFIQSSLGNITEQTFMLHIVVAIYVLLVGIQKW